MVGSRVVVLSPHPGQVRAELNCHDLGFGHRDSPEFGRLTNRITHMLFDDNSVAH
ncbi:MAG: transporter ATP-binding protein [Hyphomicrobiales bacterium]|nr:transporter ATP-binding protein [Hyphomicrobiales bacterium]